MWNTTVPAMYATWNFDSFPVDAAGAMARSALVRAEEVVRVRSGLWVFSGGVGVGKTGLAISIVNALPQSSLLCVDGFTLMTRLVAMSAGKCGPELLTELNAPEVLFIDDLGYAISSETNSRQAATRRLQEALAGRTHRLTIITLGGHSSDQATYNNFCEWLRRMGRIIDMGSTDLRSQLFAEWVTPAPVNGLGASQRLRQTPAAALVATPAEAVVAPAEAVVAPAEAVVAPAYTICFIRQGDRVLLLNRRHAPWMGMWNGVGGKLEPGETTLACALREVREETGLKLETLQPTGIVSWRGDFAPGSMAVFMAELPPEHAVTDLQYTAEGILAWHSLDWVLDPDNEGVVSDIKRYLPGMLNGYTQMEHRLLYKNGALAGYETRRL